MVVPKEGGAREENSMRRTGEVDMKDITGSPSAAILHAAKLRKRYIAPTFDLPLKKRFKA